VTTQSAQDAYTLVLAGAGAILPKRDTIDGRIIGQMQGTVSVFGSGTYGTAKGIIDSQDSVGGWATYNVLPAPADADSDGMPDAWEIANGLNPNDPSDRNMVAPSGYTMLEEYLNNIQGQTGVTSVASQTLQPEASKLFQNYPNPFNPTTVLSYDLLKSGKVSLKVYDLYGREVVSLVNGTISAGSHQVVFDGTTLASGVYFARFISGSHSNTIKLIMVK
jgi:hypothetical protein